MTFNILIINEFMQRTVNKDTINAVGNNVLVKGWVHSIRKMGRIVFIDLRDFSELLQIVFVLDDLDKKSQKFLEELHSEYVIQVEGIIQKRNEKQINQKILTGAVELLAGKLEIIAKSEIPPFEIDKDTININEEVRLKHRYLDLRSLRLHSNFILRHNIVKHIRKFFYDKDFVEIETPFISKSTPEGARDFLVPSRLHAGKFYALPQSPQQYKQLLMIGGFEKYFQIVRCFRDEDFRGNRQPEFTQLDLEMSFVDQEDILSLIEELMTGLIEKIVPYKKISYTPFPRLTYREVMKKYKTDTPDLRKEKGDKDELAFCWVTDFPMFEYKEGDKRWGAVHHPFTMPYKEDAHLLKTPEKLGEVRAHQYDLVLNGQEIFGGSIRNHDPKFLGQVFKALGHKKKEIEQKFGHLLEAFKYGAPPHGGIAGGLDRLVMVLANEENIREVIAFPKTGEGYDPMMDSPGEVSKQQLEELNIRVKRKQK